MSKKFFDNLMFFSIFANNIVFFMIYNMSIFSVILADLLLYIPCSLAYHLIFPEQIKLQREKIAQQYKEMLDDYNKDNKGDE